eukprot:TRINITY_DN2749_c0_g1_i2.p1 TRINITY_DN2749_c0_g1~~TRINITY_DN2749_c0_g1_i2.p1  ORF type:complete len:232 (+),score=52.56 TRINITY_DN2749_c0_g1_i2:176-871(+)
MTDLKHKTMPEMVFGNNNVKLSHEQTGFTLELNTFDAFKAMDHDTKQTTKVAYSEEWIQSKQSTLEKESVAKDVFNYDWTYTSNYKGTVSFAGDSTVPTIEKTTEKIDVDRLKRPDPILYYSELVLYEDELADNGTSQLSIKMRVMPTCFFILMRLWIRIDGVLFRVIDNRFFHPFEKDYVIREYSHREGSYKSITQMMSPDAQKFNDPNLIGPLLKLVETQTEKIYIQKK